jgi:serine/threonine-protein kinase RsbW
MEPRHIEIVQRIPSEPVAIKRLIDSFMHDLNRLRYDTDTTFALALGFTEAVANAVDHGNQRDPSKCVTVYYRLDQHYAELEVCDEGCGFDTELSYDPTSDEGLTRPGGRGVLLMKAYFDDVQFLSGGRNVRLTKQVYPGNAHAA